MRSKRVGLARTQALIENLKRSLDLNGAALTDLGSIVTTGAIQAGTTLSCDTDFTCGGIATFTGETTVAGIRNTDLIPNSGTAAIDLSSTTSDVKLVTTGVLAGDIKLPVATTDNVGMVIDIFIGATVASDASCGISVSNAGSTVIRGVVTTSIVVAANGKESTAMAVTGSIKRIILDSNNAASSGGAIGSRYTFIYAGANLIFVDGMGLVTGTTATLPTGVGMSTTGFA